MTNVKKYIEIIDAGTSATGITRVWSVRNKRTGQDCGRIKWHGGFRKYCFFPSDGFLFDADCLRLVADFLDFENTARKAL